MSEIITDMVTPVKVTTQEMTYSNKVYLSPQGKIPQQKRFIKMKGYVLPVAFSQTIPKGKIGLSKNFREFLALSLIDEALIYAYEPKQTDKPATSLNIKIQFLLPPKEKVEIDDVELIQQFKREFNGYYLNIEQVFIVNFKKTPIILSVQRVLGSQQGNTFLSIQTAIEVFASTDQQIRLKSTKNAKKNIFTANFSMDSLGIGGLDDQLTSLFRRAFASRRLPHSIVEKFGIKHVKGILLYGPPGTGKTLIARQLAKSLSAKSLTIVNGPEVFSKYVGESQQNIRKLFAPAREDQKKYGDQSPIHVIVFDQIDAVCRQRGSDGSGTGAKDAVVNQLLTNLDGVEALNNIIVIGMTNRKDLIDEAVLRPGRLEVHIEIGIPSEQGRLQILKIHTKKLTEQNLLDKDVSLAQIAKQAKNYTGAQLEAVIKNASSYAMMKGNNVMDFSKQLEIKAGTKLDMNDLRKALVEVTPGFGVDQQHFEIFMRNQLHNYGKTYNNIMSMITKVSNIALNGTKQLNSLLLFGPPGTGKTSIATYFAKNSRFTYVKIISPEKYIGIGTYGRINSIAKIFNDAYKAKQSLIIIDNIERLIQYVQTGPDFNNTLMQALLVLIKRIPSNPQCRLMIIGTTSNYRAMDLIDMDKAFNVKLKVPLLTRQQAAIVMGVDLNIDQAGIKKLVHFKQICRDKPKALWANLWTKYLS